MRTALSSHDVSLANDAQEGMAVLKQFEDLHLNEKPLDLIISCVHIESRGSLTVFDLLKWARGNPQMQEVPFILICSEPSSMAQSLIDSVRLAGHALGATAYMIMEKFDPKEFLNQIEYYLPEELRSLCEPEPVLEESAKEATPDSGKADHPRVSISEAEAAGIRKRIIEEKN